MHGNGVGSFYSLRTIVLNDQVEGRSFTDTTPTDGKRYRYYVQAVCPAGVSALSLPVDALPVPPPPASAPQSLAGEWTKTRQGVGITLKWAPVAGATGYVIYRSNQGEHFAWPDNFVIPLLETTWTDVNRAKKATEKKGDDHMDPSKDYYYQVTAINAGGVSAIGGNPRRRRQPFDALGSESPAIPALFILARNYRVAFSPRIPIEL